MRFAWRNIIRPILMLPIFDKSQTEINAEGSFPCIHFGTGAIGGFYQLGITKFIAENYNTQNIIFSGTSAGSFCASLLSDPNCTPETIDTFVKTYIDRMEKFEQNDYWQNALPEIRAVAKDYGINHNPDPNRLYIAATQVNGLPKRHFITNFTTFPEAIEACLASSYIPFLCGKEIAWTYKSKRYCDGGMLGDRDIPENTYALLKINPDFWGREFSIKDIYTWDCQYAKNLYKCGYHDSRINKGLLDYSFTTAAYRLPAASDLRSDEPCSNN